MVGRYQGSEFDWFLWCVRTGHGNKNAAFQFAAQQAIAMAQSGDPPKQDVACLYFLLAKRDSTALAVAKQSFQKPSLYSGLMLAILADRTKDQKLRGEAMQQVAGLVQANPQDPLADLAKWLDAEFKKTRSAAPDADGLEALMQRENLKVVQLQSCLAGLYLKQRNKNEIAKKCVELGVSIPAQNVWTFAALSVLDRELTAKPTAAKTGAKAKPTTKAKADLDTKSTSDKKSSSSGKASAKTKSSSTTKPSSTTKKLDAKKPDAKAPPKSPSAASGR